MRIVCGLKLDALEDNIDGDPVAVATAEDICEDVCNCMDVDVANGEDVYAHSNLVVPDITVDWNYKVVPSQTQNMIVIDAGMPKSCELMTGSVSEDFRYRYTYGCKLTSPVYYYIRKDLD